MKIYVASLSDYNAGRLHGCWIDCDGKSAYDLHAEVNDMLAASPTVDAEEWAIYDYESPVTLSESTSLRHVAELAEAFEGMDDSEVEAFSAFIDNGCGMDADGFRDAYRGAYRDLEAYAEEYIEETGMLDGVNDTIKNYFDFAAFASDLERGGDVWTHRGSHGLHVFANY